MFAHGQVRKPDLLSMSSQLSLIWNVSVVGDRYVGGLPTDRRARNACREARNVCRGARNVCRGARNACRGARNACRGTRNACRGTRNACREARNACRGTRNACRGTRNACLVSATHTCRISIRPCVQGG